MATVSIDATCMRHRVIKSFGPTIHRVSGATESAGAHLEISPGLNAGVRLESTEMAYHSSAVRPCVVRDHLAKREHLASVRARERSAHTCQESTGPH